MFCNRCGCPFPKGSRFCSRCGAAVVENAPLAAGQQAERHVHTLGVLWIALGAVCLLPSLFFLGIGFDHASFHPGWNPVFSPVPFLIGFPSVLLGLGAVFVGWGLLHREPWARTAAIVAGVLFLFHPLFGTLLGIFTLWVFLSQRPGPLQAGPR